MALLYPVPSGHNRRETQQFGPSHMGIEPAVYADGTRAAWWQPYKGWHFVNDYHTGLDIAADGGAPVLASEAGVVVESYFDSTNGGGHKVTVEIRPGTRYVSNHLASRLVGLGRKVERGQKIATIDSTGWSTGNHNHFVVQIEERGSDGHARLVMWNPKFFLPGGSLEDDKRIKPLVAAPRMVVLSGAGINLRTSPDLDRGAANVWATSQPEGIFRNQRRIAKLTYQFEHLGTLTNDDGRWFRVSGLQHLLYVRANLMRDA